MIKKIFKYDCMWYITIFIPLIILILDKSSLGMQLFEILIMGICLIFLLMIKRENIKILIFIIGILSIMLFQINYNKIFYDFGKYKLHLLYFIFFVIYSTFWTNIITFNKFKKFVGKNIKKINYILLVIIIIEGYMFITKKGFRYNWDGMYFSGTHTMQHTFSYFMLGCIAISIYLMIKNKSKKYIIYAMIFFIFILFTGARVALIGVGILGVAFIFIDKLNIIKIKEYLLIFLMAFILIINSSMINKFIRESSNANISGGGRSAIRNVILNEYKDFTFTEKLLGVGADKVYEITSYNMNNEIWAHNDIIQISISFGIIGIIAYLFICYRIYKLISLYSGKKIGLTMSIFVLVMGFFNGFYNYKDGVLFIPFFILMATSNSNVHNIRGGKNDS